MISLKRCIISIEGKKEHVFILLYLVNVFIQHICLTSVTCKHHEQYKVMNTLSLTSETRVSLTKDIYVSKVREHCELNEESCGKKM